MLPDNTPRDDSSPESVQPENLSGHSDDERLPGDVTQILSAIEQGDGDTAEQLLPLVYDELRKLAAAKMAQENPGQTLQATALVHEAYIRLVDVEKAQHWNSRGHFFAAAAEAMRRILIDRAREKGRLKSGGNRVRLDFDGLEIAILDPDADDAADKLLLLDEALETLAREDLQTANLLKLRFFAGLTMDDAAHALGLSRRTAYRCWAFARAWLYDRLGGDAGSDNS